MDFQTPILVIGFNRPDKLRKILSIIALKKPKCIYFSFDGPRNEFLKDKQLIEDNLRLIEELIDWAVCEVNREPSNLGCKNHVIKAITWFFEKEENGIILEDDCVPSLSFFKYAENLLEVYRDDTRVGMISGNNHGMNKPNYSYDYYFTRYISIWGWATWRDRWMGFADFLNGVNSLENKDVLASIQTSMMANLRGDKETEIRYSNMIKAISGVIDTWDYILSGFFLATNQLTIVPKNNLISNIGYGDDATHTKNELHKYSNLETFELEGEIVHPQFVLLNQEYDFNYSGQGTKTVKKGIVGRLMKR